MSGGGRFDHLAAGLPDPAGWVGAASDHVDEADDAVRVGGGRRTQRGAFGQGRRVQVVAHQPDPGRYHGGAGECCLSDRFGAKAIRRIAATGKRIQAAGGAVRTTLRDRSRAAGKRAHAIAAKLRTRSAAGRDEAQTTVRRVTGQLAELAATTADKAERLLANAQQALRRAKAKADKLRKRGIHDAAAGRRRGRLARAVNDLTDLLEATRQIVAQTRQRVAGHTPDGATRRVSLHDADARPIAKGRLGRPVEFGHKAQIVDNDDGIVLDHTVEQGNPPTRRNWPRPWRGSRSGPDRRPARSPPTAATAKPASTTSSPTSV